MQRSRLKNIANKSKEMIKPVVGEFEQFKNSLPIEIDDNYRLEAAWKAYGKPKNYQEALWEGLVQPIDDKTFKMPSIGYNEETEEYEYLNKGKENETVNRDIRVWDNDVIPFVKELKHGGYIRVYNDEKDCWTYKKGGKIKVQMADGSGTIEIDYPDKDQKAGRKPIGEKDGKKLYLNGDGKAGYADPKEGPEQTKWMKEGGKNSLAEIFKNGGKPKNEENLILERLFKEWPVLSTIKFNIVPDSTFTKENTGIGSIEYISPNEEEYITYPNGYKHKNPHIGEASIIYNPSDNDYEDIKMDLLHALRTQDPKYRELVESIDKVVLEGNDDLKTNAKLKYEQDYKEYGKEYAPFKQYVSNEVDGLLRNLFYNGSPEVLKNKNYYPDKKKLKEWNKHLLPYTQKIEQYLSENPQAFKQGGQMNVIPEGALHARKNNMEGAGEDFTHKGIPVVDNDGEQQAEIERNEVIFNKDLTDFIESNYKKFKSEETKNNEKDEIAIKVGKRLVKELLTNTDDRTGLISEVEQKI